MQKIGMKAICEYVKVSEATVLIWIRESGFPARKVRGKGIWLSDTVAIDAWLIWFVQGGEVKRVRFTNGGNKASPKRGQKRQSIASLVQAS